VCAPHLQHVFAPNFERTTKSAGPLSCDPARKPKGAVTPLSTQNDSEPVGVTDTPTSIIDLRLPEGTGRAQLGFFAETVEDFERVRAQVIASGRNVDDRLHYNQSTGLPYATCGWVEGDASISMHGPRGYRRPEDQS
jgi:hypothetical protein